MIEIKGLNKVVKGLKNFGSQGLKAIDKTTEGTASELARNASRFAPKDLGVLKGSIQPFRQDEADYKVIANATGNAPYAAYMEFGTGGLVEVPEELADMAIKFKGKGIKRVDIRPRPYMYPALLIARDDYVKDLEAELELLIKKV